jgi:hypothetical protein
MATVSITYWTEWFEASHDGTIELKVTWIDDDGSHSTGMYDIPPEDPEYEFWRWVLADSRRRKGLKREPEIAALKAEFKRQR